MLAEPLVNSRRYFKFICIVKLMIWTEVGETNPARTHIGVA
jgi:hypothetical protein